MRFQFMLIPAALVASATVQADQYLTLEDAQQLLFPGAIFDRSFFSLNDRQKEDVIVEAQVTVWSRHVKVWRVSTGGWFYIDQVAGRDDWVTYAVGLDENGAVMGIEILECLERWNQIRHPDWRAQFVGERRGTLELNGDILNISGTTLSVAHITEGVRRVLVTHGLFVAPSAS
jgi:hypothetical protein